MLARMRPMPMANAALLAHTSRTVEGGECEGDGGAEGGIVERVGSSIDECSLSYTHLYDALLRTRMSD